jgi:DNA-binding CsgD family transcriptional regulator
MEFKARNNLAEVYRRTGAYERSLRGFQESIALNKEHGYSSNLIANYLGLYFLYKDMEDYKSALDAIELHEMIKDSLIGQETQEKIALLETKLETVKTEVALQESKTDLATVKLTNTRIIFLAGILLLITGGVIWRWRIQVRYAGQQQEETRKHLLEVTKLLASKYGVISELKDQVVTLESEKIKLSSSVDPPKSIYTKTILTDEDWNIFREGFEKTYPKYQHRLRNAFPELTPAEERLFLLLKLNLGRKEIADLLGLSVGSIKKSRTRLRKRLQLESEDSLEDFIHKF